MSSDEVRDVIATLREVPRYVVRNDALTSRAVVGFDKWKGTTDVVLHADHLTAMQEKDRRHAEALAEAEQRIRTDLVTSVLDGIAVLEGRRLVFLSDVRDAIARLPRNADTRDALAAIDALAAGQAPAPTNDGDN